MKFATYAETEWLLSDTSKPIMKHIEYGYVRELPGVAFDDAVVDLHNALEREGFTVLNKIDIQGTLRQSLDIPFRRYTILSACDPGLSLQALAVEPHVGLLLPVHATVQEAPSGGVSVAISDPKAIFLLIPHPGLDNLVVELDQRVRRAMGHLHEETAAFAVA